MKDRTHPLTDSLTEAPGQGSKQEDVDGDALRRDTECGIIFK